MQREELNPLYTSPDFAAKIPIQECLWRYDIGGNRNYRRRNGDTFRSLTTFISMVESNPVHLNTWREDMIEELGSGEKVDQLVQALADYGSIDHEAFAIIAQEGGVDWEQLTKWCSSKLSNAGISGKTLHKATSELRNDTACFMTFVHDYNVEILSIELPVWSIDGYATLIDIVCRKDVQKYVNTPPEKRKRHNAIINLKSGRKAFFESHCLQLIGERKAFNEVYGTQFGEIDAIYNLAPTNWTTTPDYKLKDQRKVAEDNGQELIQLFDNYVQRAKIRGYLGTPKMKIKTFKGVTKLGSNPINQLFFQEYGQFVDDDKNFEDDKNVETINNTPLVDR